MVARRAHPYRDLDVIDSRAPRTNQSVVGVLSLVAVATGWWWLLALLEHRLVSELTMHPLMLDAQQQLYSLVSVDALLEQHDTEAHSHVLPPALSAMEVVEEEGRAEAAAGEKRPNGLALMRDARRYPIRNDAASTASVVDKCFDIAVVTNPEDIGSIVAVDVAKVVQVRGVLGLVEYDTSEAVFAAEALPEVIVALTSVPRASDHATGCHQAKVGSPIAVDVSDMNEAAGC